MAGDWPRDPRAYGSPQHPEPPAPVRTLPSVAELLSTRPSANSTIPAHHHHHHRPEYSHARSTPPSASLPTATASSSAASSYWNAVNHRQNSPPVSPTEQRPPTESVRVYQQPVLRRQHPSKADPALQQPELSSSVHSAAHSTVQTRQDSAIDQHRFETGSDAQLSKSNVSSSHHQSPKDDTLQIVTRLNSYQPTSSTPAYATSATPHQSETHPSQAGYHSHSLSSAAPYPAASPRSHEHSTERSIPVDIRNGSDPRPNITGPSSLPEQFFTQQNNFGTRQQRYNVRFAANYTSENMPPSQKPRNEPPTPPTAPAAVAEPEQPRSSPTPVSASEEPATPASNGSSRPTEPQPPRPARDSRDRGDREPSVERCVGCNEAWRRPIPDMDSDKIAPAQDNAEYMRLAGNLIDRLRNERKKADAAYEEWKWRHSHCYRQTSPYSTGSVDDASKASAATPQTDGATNGHTPTTNNTNKRKSELPHEPHSASKQRKRSSISPAPAVRKPDSP
ncbi:hypothetical protein E8E12_001815 [Didymella heteroderae]|uniref:Uncharacterized protein n=1 Tax=Didymella heteroderae TaxID=1769908 RepID=A0A9P4WHD0_9PLEO|nr:hypothetical protein E8E12_001815 [Didymella heteroderae]